MKIERSELPLIQERLNVCFDYLRSKGTVHTKQDVADRMGNKKHSVSRAFNGMPEYLTENFIDRFAATFGLNSDWIRYGNGEMVDGEAVPQGTSIVNTQVGNGNHFANGSVDRFLNELAAQRELTREAQQQLTKSQEQMDRLITIIENLKK